jgi:hypothetical protein
VNGWEWFILCWSILGAVLAVLLVGRPRTGTFTGWGALFAIAYAAATYMAVAS